MFRFVDLGDEIVEFGHGFVFTRLRVFHGVEELLSLELEGTELGLHIYIAFIKIGAHLFLFESQQAGPE